MNTTTTIEKMIDSIAAVCINLGLRGGYTPEEIADLVCDIEFAHMYDHGAGLSAGRRHGQQPAPGPKPD